MVRDLIPARARQTVYAVLGTLYALEGIFDVVPSGAESRLLAALAVLGFGLAAGNVAKG